jgi:short-subunit dehydrogenase
VNDAGAIQVGPLAAMTFADFEDAMRLHFFAPLQIILGVRDEMRARGGGRIANVSSIGGLVSVPHLLPYSASKFALVGLSQGMTAELARDRILVCTVAPGLMRTGSPRRALFKGDREKEYAWFAISDSLPLLSTPSDRAARRIVRALERGEPRVVIGLPAKVAAIANGLAPGLVTRALTVANALLPGGTDPRERPGFDSASPWAPSILTTLTERAAARNNVG